MDQVPKPAKADSPVSRRAFMHAGASAGFITAAVGWGVPHSNQLLQTPPIKRQPMGHRGS